MLAYRLLPHWTKLELLPEQLVSFIYVSVSERWDTGFGKRVTLRAESLSPKGAGC